MRLFVNIHRVTECSEEHIIEVSTVLLEAEGLINLDHV
jgi:hypothetical protein